MAKIIFKGVPDFTEVRAEIAKLKQEVASVSSTKVNLNGTTQGLNGAADAAKNAAKSAEAFEKAFLNASDKVQKGTKEITEKTNLLGDSFTNVYLKMLQWQVMGTIVSKTIGAFRDAISTMKAVDDEMVTVRKVTGFTAEQMEELRDRAYETASAYGEAADEYLNSVAAFARAGYGEQADALAELATKTKLVGDTTAETAQQFLLSVDAAYQYKGNIDALTKVLDGANEIDNKYATSIEKLAEGLGTVAPVAAQAHVGIDELTAAIGTITAVTQRSGSEAARAFRALVLNIVGDTKTEIDEGVTWTTGEIAGLKDVIRQYAPAAYEAAKATGEIIDPMEAIGGLAQSMEHGLLTEQKLMEMVSDIGGKLRTSQLLALIQNWDMYQSMLKDYANAVGSADEEISNAMDSWTRKTNILKNEWTEFIQSMVSTDTVKGGLDVLIGTVEVLNTDLGRAAVTAGAVSLGLVGIQAAAKGATAAVAKLSAAGIAMNPWIVAIGLAAGAFSLVWQATEDYRKSLDALNTEIESSTTKLEENKKRLDEINATNWADLTPEILSERDALEAENAELERQIQKYKDLAEVKGSHVNNNGTISVLGYQAKASGTVSEASRTDGTAGADTGLRTWTQSAATAKEAIDAATASLENAYQVMDGTIAATTKRTQVTLEGADAYNYLRSAANDLITTLDTEHALTADEVLTYNDLIKVMPQYIDYLAKNGEQTGELKQLLDLLTAAYSRAAEAAKETADATASAGDEAGAAASQYGSLAEMVDEVSARYNLLKTAQDETNKTGVVSANTLSALLSKYPDLLGYLEQTENGYKLTKGAVEDYIEAQKTQCRVALADAKSAAESVITQEIQKAYGYNATTEAIYEQIIAMQDLAAVAPTAANDQLSGLRRTLLMKGVPEEQIAKLLNGAKDYNAKLKEVQSRLVALNNIKVGSVSTSKSSTGKSEKDAELERLKDIVSLRKSELSLMQERGDSTADQIAKMREIQAALHAQAEYMRGIGASQADINALSTEHWKITKQIQELEENRLDELKSIVSLRKSELSLMQERGDSTADQIAKMREIQQALLAQAGYLKEIGGSQEDINALATEYYRINSQIKDLQEALWKELEDAVNKKLEEAAEARDKQTAAIDKQIEALRDAKEAEDEALKLEELKAAVLEKQNALLDAQKERTVRVFNAASGQWEWEANASSVKSAQDAYEKAKEDLAEYERELALQREIDELEAKKKLIEETYETLKAEWKAITDSLQEPTREIDDILSDLAANGTPKMREQVEAVNGLLGKLNEYIAGAMNDIQQAGQQAANAVGGGGYHFDYNKNPGGGWTQAEMNEGFKPSGGSGGGGGGYHFDYNKNPGGGWTDAEMNEGFRPSSGGSKGSWRDTTAEATGVKNSIRGPDLSRRTDLAGKVVNQGTNTVTYDKKGYAVKATPNTTKASKKKYDSGGILEGLGGIKATERDEIVIPPFLAEKMLEPSADSTFQKRMSELGWLYGAGNRGDSPLEKTVMSRTSYDHYGDSYSVNGVQIGAEAADRLTVAQVMRALNSGAGNLGLYKH